MRCILFVSALASVAVCGAKSVSAQDDFCASKVPGEVFCDDFSDGNADAPPVQWALRSIEGVEYNASSGDYVWTTGAGFEPGRTMSLGSLILLASTRKRLSHH